MLKKLFKESRGPIVGGLLTVLVGFFFLALPLGKKFQDISYDLPFPVSEDRTNNDVVLVYMDEDSYENLKQSYLCPFDRSLHAKLLRRLKTEGAKAAIFDVVFSDPNPTNPLGDEEFAQAIKDFGKVVLGADKVNKVYQRVGMKTEGSIETPLDKFLDGAVALGTVDLNADSDLIVRKHGEITKDMLVPTLSWAAADLFGAPITKQTNDWSRTRWLNYYGPIGMLPNVSYYRALATNDILPGFFRDKVVFIGARTFTKSATERKDEYSSPYSYFVSKNAPKFMPGTEIQATLFLNLMHSDWLSRLSKLEEINLVLLLGLVFGIGLAQLRPFFACFMGVLGIIAVTMLGYFMATRTHVWFAWLIGDIQVAAAAGWSVIFNSVKLHVQKRLMEESLSAYVSPSRVKQIAKNPEILKQGAQKAELSILFSDIANFTTMSEGMDSDDLAALMNNYFEGAVGKCIHPAEGTVVKFIGDAIFAIWNAPEPQANHQEKACRGALLLRDQVTDFKGSKPGLEVRTRIGLHAGDANVGNFGSSKRFDYTALGENINLAARMEGLNKYLGTDVLITGDIERAVRGKFVTRFLGMFQLKGFAKVVAVYELIAVTSAEAIERSRPCCDAFEAARKAFAQKQFGEAEAAFQGVLKLHGKDGPAKFYLKHMAEMHPEELPAAWNGEIELKDK